MNLPTSRADGPAEDMGRLCDMCTLLVQGDCLVQKSYSPSETMFHLLPPLRALELEVERLPRVPRQYLPLYGFFNVVNVPPGASLVVMNSSLEVI